MTLAERLASALADSRGLGPQGDDIDLADTIYADAAVLIAVTDRPEPGVILTLRHADLRRHAGQIAFPGGKVDPEDEDAIAAALREADEEIGLPPGAVEVVGTSNRYRTSSGFDILPVIGVTTPDLPLTPHEAEVADVFEVPFGFLLEQANHIIRSVEKAGRMHQYYEINWGERRIWGATAGIVVNLASRLARFA
ncbi:CoA pyrophosphatase [Sphingomonas bacterium]|uniref:CoA pyrophosphatase n=1 Tax=Sphingomonas bacterium TaxID=1895847 RepID=UPI0015764EA0|nr:CoA pyrophosphatase [Sphingomonas bacterium]